MPRGIPKTKTFQRDMLHAMKIASGHLNKVVSMMERDEYCIDIVHQSKAVQAALKKIDERILENHIRHCVAHEVSIGNAESIANELVSVIKKS